jgi:hypothetical protein
MVVYQKVFYKGKVGERGVVYPGMVTRGLITRLKIQHWLHLILLLTHLF